MQALLTRWMSRSPSLFGGRSTSTAVTPPHAVARRDGARPSRLAPVVRRLEAASTHAGGVPGNVRTAPGGVRLRVDPSDQRRTRISGRMGDVCDALDALIRLQQAQA